VTVPRPDSRKSADRPIVLIGLPGSGKTRVGRSLARRMGWDFADTDEVIEQNAGHSIEELARTAGWASFRRLEQRALERLLGRERIVIATGGGVVESASNCRAIMLQGRAVWLRAERARLLKRLRDDPVGRPLLAGDAGQRLAELARVRDPLYAQVAAHSIDTETMTPEAVAEQLLAVMGLERTGERS
jgi:shikimate kinase